VACAAPNSPTSSAATPKASPHAAGPSPSDVRDGDIDRKLALALEIDDQGRSKRVARLDGVNTAQADLGELMRIIWLTPAMDRVFAGPAGDRRRFLDRQVMAHFPSHGAFSTAYEKAMRQRNALLERGRADPVWLDALELGMASAGAAMALHRVDAVRTDAGIHPGAARGGLPEGSDRPRRAVRDLASPMARR
jgi:DNA replication and repair protein RecF